MQIPDNIAEKAITLTDQLFDLRGLSAYSALAVSTLRNFISSGNLPAYKVGGKILVSKSEFHAWLQQYRINKRQQIDTLVDKIMDGIRG